MAKILKVMLWGEEVGRLSWSDSRKLSYFTFNPKFLSKQLNIAPITAPINDAMMYTDVWGDTQRLYQRLPAFLADSLPDAWGNQLFTLWMQQNHISESEITPLDKLAFIGKRGMGALEFEPEYGRKRAEGKIDIQMLASLAERIFHEREDAKILPTESLTMQSLLRVGTSAGGRQPKAVLAINRETGEIRSGQIAGQQGFNYYLLKFGNSQYASAELEMAYYRMATAAGIAMMESELFTVEGNHHFLTSRFDREGQRKLHTQTLAAMQPEADSYEQLISVCRRLKLPESDIAQVFRRMVFNHLANNTDDHNKNFSFIMNEQGEWRLSPAYDVTYIINAGGFQPNREHCLYVRAKLYDVTLADVLEFAQDNGIRRPEQIIREVVAAIRQFRSFALESSVPNEWIWRVEQCLTAHLRAWGEDDADQTQQPTEIRDHRVANIRIEQAYKGNYHLMATIDGCERKFIIRKSAEEYALIAQHGAQNLSATALRQLLATCFARFLQ
jgi:serine/threonine-protein kinase HipA